MKRTLALLILVPVLALACSDDAPPVPTATPEPTQTATPEPTPPPTPEPEPLSTYESLELGVRFEHPEVWVEVEAGEDEEREEWLVMAGEDGGPSLRLLVRFHDMDVTLDERMDSVIEELLGEDEEADDGSAEGEDDGTEDAGEEEAEAEVGEEEVEEDDRG